MPDERLGAFLACSHGRVLDHCDALLARPLSEEQRSRLLALRAVAEAELQSWKRGRSGERQRPGSKSRVLELT